MLHRGAEGGGGGGDGRDRAGGAGEGGEGAVGQAGEQIGSIDDEVFGLWGKLQTRRDTYAHDFQITEIFKGWEF